MSLADQIGPFDLSKFLDVQFGGEKHEAAIQKTLKAAKAAGKTAAIFCTIHLKDSEAQLVRGDWADFSGTSGAQAKMRLEQGFDMVSVYTDVGAIATEFERQLAAVKGVEIGKGRTGY